MPFEPTKREPKVHLDRWLILTDKIKDGENWIRSNFTFGRRAKRSVKRSVFTRSEQSDWLTVFPIFDPIDPVEIMIFTSGSLYGVNFYNYVDIRSKLVIMQDEFNERTLLFEVKASIRLHPEGPRSQHPHPEPRGEQRDRLDLRRRWLTGDAFPDAGEHDHARLSDGPEWLASALRLRRRR